MSSKQEPLIETEDRHTYVTLDSLINAAEIRLLGLRQYSNSAYKINFSNLGHKLTYNHMF